MQQSSRVKNTSRKVLAEIPSYPEPKELYTMLMKSKGWDYKTNMDNYLMRDRALASVLYVAELRISEALRLVKKQFKRKEDHIFVEAIQLSKRKKGKIAYRDARLPLKGERAVFTQLILNYLDTLNDEDRLFPWSLEVREFDTGHTYTTRKGQVKPIISFQMIGEHRAWQIVNALLPKITEHWLRAFGDSYLYDHMDHDILAVSDEVKVDPRTLQQYIRGRSRKYKPA